MTREQYISRVKKSQREFRRFLMALCCGDAFMADEVAQEAYIKAYMALDSLKDVEKFDAWVFRIGYNTFMSHRRMERQHVDYEQAGQLQGEERTDKAFDYQALYAALGLLPASERTAVLLYYMQGYSTKEIALIIDASTDAVKQYLSRGRKHLRNLLTKEL